MCRCALLWVCLCFAVGAEGGRIFNPDQLSHAEHDPCTTRQDTQGTCERSCSFGTSFGNECGIKDNAFLYCCDSNPTRTVEKVTDISPPITTFECGKNSNNTFYFEPYGPTGEVLRPEASPPAVPDDSEKATVAPPPARGGVPVEAYYDYLNFEADLPDGVYAAVGGITAEKNAWPWMALVGKKVGGENVWFCGGVLINEQWVLSALHCFIHHIAQVVRLGEHDYSIEYEGSTHQDYVVTETVMYPDYKDPQAYHDIALLKLASKVLLQDHISPVCLPWGRESDVEITNHIGTLTGWGDTEYGGFPSTILQEVNVTVFPVNQCDRSYSGLPHYPTTWPQGIGKETLCAGDPNGGRDACQGDSGGPLVSQDANGAYVLAGIVSRGYGCGHKDYPGLYANVRHPAYLSWIKKVAFSSS